MPSLKDRVRTRVDEVRQWRPLIDHLVRMIEHYGKVKGSLQAGAVTYFAFLSFFPILALGFAVVGFIASTSDEADFQTDLIAAINNLLPGLVTDDEDVEGKLYIKDIQDAAPGILSIGLPVLLYSGLGWLSAMRQALVAVFVEPKSEQPNFVMGKLRDLASLATIGFTLVVSVSIAGLVTGFSEHILEWVDLADSTVASILLWVITVAFGLAANAVLFFTLFRLLASPNAPTRSLWSGALLGAIGFEVLKVASSLLLASTESSPATQAFGIALILLVWINYFSRVVMYAAAWSYTSPAARDERERLHQQNAERDAAIRDPEAKPVSRTAAEEKLQPGAAFALGGAAALGAVVLARKTIKRGDG